MMVNVDPKSSHNQYGTYTGPLYAHSIGCIDETPQFHRRIVRGDKSRFVSQQILAVLK